MSDPVWRHTGAIVKHLFTRESECGAYHRRSRNQVRLAAMPCDGLAAESAADDRDGLSPVTIWRRVGNEPWTGRRTMTVADRFGRGGSVRSPQ